MMSARVSEILDDLIEVCREGESCYKACAQLVRDDMKRRSLKHRAQRATRARRQLRKLRDAIGDVQCNGPALGQPVPGTVYCTGFGAVSDEASALGMCERLEAVAMMRYRDALDFELPEPVRKLLRRQFDELVERYASAEHAAPRHTNVERPVRLALAQ